MVGGVRNPSHATQARVEAEDVVGKRGVRERRQAAEVQPRHAARNGGSLETALGDPGPLFVLRHAVAVARPVGPARDHRLEHLALEVGGVLLAACEVRRPERSEERTAPLVALDEVPCQLCGGGGVPWLDGVGGKRPPRYVALQAAAVGEPRLPAKFLRRLRVEARRAVVPVAGTDLELHSLVEEHLALGPDLGREVVPQHRELFVSDDVTRAERQEAGLPSRLVTRRGPLGQAAPLGG